LAVTDYSCVPGIGNGLDHLHCDLPERRGWPQRAESGSLPLHTRVCGRSRLIKRDFEAAYPHIKLNILDLRSNYYGPDDPNYIETVDADVFEVDSILLAQFVADKKIRELPTDVLLHKQSCLRMPTLGHR